MLFSLATVIFTGGYVFKDAFEEVFEKVELPVEVDARWLGSSHGWNAFLSGEVDVVITWFSSLEDAQKRAGEIGVKAVYEPFAGAPIAVITCKLSNYKGFSTKELSRLLLDPGEKMVFIVHPDYRQAVYPLLKKKLIEPYGGKDISNKVFYVSSNSKLEKLVVQNPGSIGIMFLREIKPNKWLEVLPVDGVSPAYENCESGRYPLIRKFYLVYRQDSPSAGKLARFLSSSPEVRKILKKYGFVVFSPKMR